MPNTRFLLVVALIFTACGGDAGDSCGNGTIDFGEGCDDGNRSAGDGCSSYCIEEAAEGSVFESTHPLFANLAQMEMAPAGNDTAEGGSFRTKCALSHFNYDDPLVYPGQAGASHLHMFFGNTAIDAFTTQQNITAMQSSTCQGGPLNQTGYWVPTLLRPTYRKDAAGQFVTDASGRPIRTGEFAVVFPFDTYELDEQGAPIREGSGFRRTANLGPDIYYKRVIPGEIHPMPTGLRMIAGDMNATPDNPTPVTVTRWNCHDEREGLPGLQSPTIPDCHSGTNGEGLPFRLHLAIFFPPCWDGVNLDSSNHKSHMAYPNYIESGDRYECPATHPVLVPQVSYHLYYPITAEILGPTGDTSDWLLSSDHSTNVRGGASAHGDWMMAWNEEIVRTFTRYCLNEGRHCANGDLGNGFRLFSEIPGGGLQGLVPHLHQH